PTFVDIDGDGDLDALVGNDAGNTLFYQNTGTSSSPAFAATITNPFGLTDVGTGADPTFVDIDGDGDLDALVGVGFGNTLFYQNTGTASSPAFAATTANPFGLSDVGLFASPTFVDIDGDGDLDALVGNGDGNTLFYQNTGTASSAAFAAATTNPFGLTNVGNNGKPTFIDIDGDGDLDAFIGNYNGDTLFYQNTGTATSAAFAAATTDSFGLGGVGYNATPTFVDIDADGDLDAIIGNYNGDTFFFINAVPPTPGITLTQSNGNTAVTEGGSTDSYTLVLDSAPTADVVITLGNTNGQVGTDVTTLTFTSANWNVAQTVTVTAVNDTMGEFTNTGVINYTVASTDANYNNFAIANTIVTVTDNDLAVGNPTFQAPVTNPFGFTDVGYMSSPTFVDIDADGDLDALIGNYDGNTLYYQNTGTASSAAFAAKTTNPFGLTDVGNAAVTTFADIDADGDLDAFVGNGNGNILFYQNTGTASSAAYATPSANTFGLSKVASNASPTFVDIDGDGDLDAFVGERYGNIKYFENTGTSTSAAFATASTNPFGLSNVNFGASPNFVDIDGDGDLDALVGHGAGNGYYPNPKQR
ncbi:MAG: FG-GAP-like repeat-containing protein, partial [Methylococcales bacterium]|nr:FG-GAP-like repeat-containing protein [Methylococcales bacterium]